MSSTTRRRAAIRDVPMLGALMRLARQEIVAHVSESLAAAGMGDVKPAQFALSQQLARAPEGLRLTELASYAGVTKASMSALVDALESRGYVRRVADPADQRAQRVRFTPRGWKLAAQSRRAVQRVERRWCARVGERDVESLRRILRAIVASR